MVKATRGRVARVLLDRAGPAADARAGARSSSAPRERGSDADAGIYRRDRVIALPLGRGRVKAPGRLRAAHRPPPPPRDARGARAAGRRHVRVRRRLGLHQAVRAARPARPRGRRAARRRDRQLLRRLLGVAYAQGRRPAEVRRRRAAAALRGRRPRRARVPRRRRDARARCAARARSRPGGAGHAAHVGRGVHSGELTCFLVGASHRELLVAGPAATASCGWRRRPAPARSSSAPATAAALPGAALGAPRGHGLLLASRARRADDPRPSRAPTRPRASPRAAASRRELRAHVARRRRSRPSTAS